MIRYCEIATPIGPLLLAGDDAGLRLVSFQGGPHRIEPAADWRRSREPFRATIAQLQAYFAGTLKDFDLPLALEGTAFQQKVWALLRAIPYGETMTYAELARRLGRSTAYRAVGAANRRNPIPIIIPCHRVIGTDGSLTGFGGGLAVKRALLRLEGGDRRALQRPLFQIDESWSPRDAAGRRDDA